MCEVFNKSSNIYYIKLKERYKMASLLVGRKISDTKILVETIYNLEVSDNDYLNPLKGASLDITKQVVVDETILPPKDLPPGSYYYVNPVTKEQWFA
jgi:hypothetical protein